MLWMILICALIIGCTSSTGREPASGRTNSALIDSSHQMINEQGMTIETRFIPPLGFQRRQAAENSFAAYLQNLPLKLAGTKVKYYNGDSKNNDVYEAVVDMEISNRDLQQCADAIMRLRGEYFYANKQFDEISFTLTNGFKMDYVQWMAGNRVKIEGNTATWYNKVQPSNTYDDFRSYMDFVFTYAGTLSLSKELKSRQLSDIEIGDVFIKGGSPGHAVIVVDMAINEMGEKVILLAQSYMPAQETQILKNSSDTELSPWYSTSEVGRIITPEWTFDVNQLKTW